MELNQDNWAACWKVLSSISDSRPSGWRSMSRGCVMPIFSSLSPRRLSVWTVAWHGSLFWWDLWKLGTLNAILALTKEQLAPKIRHYSHYFNFNPRSLVAQQLPISFIFRFLYSYVFSHVCFVSLPSFILFCSLIPSVMYLADWQKGMGFVFLWQCVMFSLIRLNVWSSITSDSLGCLQSFAQRTCMMRNGPQPLIPQYIL